jgi:hypothetical protein
MLVADKPEAFSQVLAYNMSQIIREELSEPPETERAAA